MILSDSPLAEELAKNLRKRQAVLFSNAGFQAAVLLDPRCKLAIRPEAREEVIKYIKSVNTRIAAVEEEVQAGIVS